MTHACRWMRRPGITPRAVTALALGAGLALSPAWLHAHAVVVPKSSTPGAYERYVLRVPNEKGVATLRVELQVPAGVRVTAFADVPGWRLDVVTDSARRIVGAVWTGTLPPQRFVEFPFVAANPQTDVRISWPAIQTYADGERVTWSGPEGSRTPASITQIRATPSAAGTVGDAGTPWVSWVALAIALVSLGLVLRPRGEAAGADQR